MSLHHHLHQQQEDDTGSFSSSVCTPEYAIPEDMTEERAMEIWLNRDREINERIQRERAEREGEERGREESSGEVIIERELAERRQQQPTNQPAGRSSRGQQRSVSSSTVSQTSGNSISGTGRYHRATTGSNNRGHSEAWQQAISSNAMGQYDPSYHDAWHAYQRFINLNQPGIAENYVASTPGLARLMEEQRMASAEERAEERRREREAAQQAEGEAMQRQRTALEAHQRPEAPQEEPHYDNALIAAQARELERLSQAHHRSQQEGANHSTPNHSTPISRPDHGSSRSSINTSTVPSSSSRIPASSNAPPKKDDKRTNSFYLALPHTTDYNTKPVMCWYCRVQLYTHPLAQNYFCQTCGKISTLDATEVGESGGGGESMVMESKQGEWEEKMMDQEDYGDVDMTY